jgi:hypothetical protein
MPELWLNNEQIIDGALRGSADLEVPVWRT